MFCIHPQAKITQITKYRKKQATNRFKENHAIRHEIPHQIKNAIYPMN